MENQFILMKKFSFASMCNCPDKDIRSNKFSCVLNCCNEYPGDLFPYA